MGSDTTTAIRPFAIEVPQADLDDLRERLGRVRWPRELPGGGWERGVPLPFLRELADHWRTGFDWRRQERALNALPQFTADVDGQALHFAHVRSPEPGAVPLLLNHGWPNSLVEFLPLIGHLTDPRAHGADPARAFHVVVPSAPGYGYSAAPSAAGWSTARTGGLWARLMRALGYDRYGVQGGDLGAYIAPAVAQADPGRVSGVYITAGLGFPTEADVPGMTPEELAHYEGMRKWSAGGLDHHALLRRGPQTFDYGWADSPVALLAWMAHKFQEFHVAEGAFTDVIDRDLFLANVSLYWFTRTAGTSSWPMYDTEESAWPEGQRHVPTGVYSGPPGIRRLAELRNDVVHWPEDNPGRHHFVTMESPGPYAADLRAFFAKVG
ncbi:epoxide hydrolase 1 [Streptomonospora sp. S1-112]|uniref:Epoxide hydrolase 1 n=1 Tax=Streptomonospora mangrovi TaxID=2883123 RepID=A0A9X3NNC1_9ACTN|nr:epoxide hydrolase family protein [Streptomonospora mangrovi]MDA0566627.1 epoxide hydrolase 1 [Streptomonospora mangrovi]